MLRDIKTVANTMLIAAQCKIRDFVRKENGDVNVVSIVVLIGIAVLLAILFRKAISNLLNNMFNTIGNSTKNALNES